MRRTCEASNASQVNHDDQDADGSDVHTSPETDQRRALNLSDESCVRLECVRHVCRQHASAAVAGLVSGAALAMSLAGQVSHAREFLWLASLAITRLIIGAISSRVAPALALGRKTMCRVYVSSRFFEGIIWGVSPFVLQVRDQRYEVFVLMSVIAVSIVSPLALAPFVSAAYALTLPIHLLLVMWFVNQGGEWGWTAAGGVVLIHLMTTMYLLAAHRLLKNALSGRLENARLAKQLDQARKRAEATNVELLKRNVQLRETARRDPLTGLYNRRHFMERLEQIRMSDVANLPWYLVILDADYFKRINDQFGHQAGDEALIAIANAASSEVRWTDCVARIGGEEFGLLLQGLTHQQAVNVVDRVRAAVSEVDLGFGTVTLSAGLVVGTEGMESAAALAAADAAMYEAKRKGRNRLECYRSGLARPADPNRSGDREATERSAAEASRLPMPAGVETALGSP